MLVNTRTNVRIPPLRLFTVDGLCDTTTGPRFCGSGLPQSIVTGWTPAWLGYVWSTIFLVGPQLPDPLLGRASTAARCAADLSAGVSRESGGCLCAASTSAPPSSYGSPGLYRKPERWPSWRPSCHAFPCGGRHCLG